MNTTDTIAGRGLEALRAAIAGQVFVPGQAGFDQARSSSGRGCGCWRQSVGSWRLDAEAGNLTGAVRWYLAHDTGPLPHLFRVLWPFWFLLDLVGEGPSWVEQLLPSIGTLDPQARAELAWAPAVIDVGVGDDAAALADRQSLAPLLAGISDPFLHAVSQLAIAWTLPITGDLDRALREATVALDELRAQDEPVFTAMAAFTAGSLNSALGRYDDALRHMREARAGVRRGRPGAGGAVGGRGRGAAAPGRLAGMADAAPGRGRDGGPGSPEAGRGAFDQAYSAGSGFSQREAVAAAWNQPHLLDTTS